MLMCKKDVREVRKKKGVELVADVVSVSLCTLVKFLLVCGGYCL